MKPAKYKHVFLAWKNAQSEHMHSIIVFYIIRSSLLKFSQKIKLNMNPMDSERHEENLKVHQ